MDRPGLKAVRKNPTDSMPGGRFPIANLKYLSNAKHDIGRAGGSKAAVIQHIDARAKAIGGAPVGKSKPASGFRTDRYK